METIDMTPTPLEYVNIVSRFRSQILADVKRSRFSADVEILRSIIEIAMYLGAQENSAELKDLLLNSLK